MDNVLIEINKKTRQVFLTNSVIGNDGENLQENLVFSFNDEFVDGTGRLELIKPDKEKAYVMLDKIDETYQIPVKSIITKGGRLTMQLVITQGTDPNAIPIFKSNKFYVVVNSSINFLIEEPDEYPQWIDVANTKLNEIDEAILEASNLDIDVNKEDNVATITLTDKEGQTKEVQILDGERGPQGIQDETGPAGVDGKDGIDGQDATINGVNSINIEAGENITLAQEGNTLTINSTGGGEVSSVNGQTGDVVIDIPDDTNDLTNGAGYITADADNLTNYYKKSETYTQTEINNKLSAVYKYKGTVSTYADLPSTDLTIGDVYNIETADSTHGIKAGDNVAWNGSQWDVLAGTIDLSNYVTNTDYALSSTGGVIKTASGYATNMYDGKLYAQLKTYNEYNEGSQNMFISKGTLENVLTGKGYTSNQGTITSVKMNGSTIASSGEADLGTVITQHQDISGKQDIIQYSTMPTASSENVGKIVQFTGTTDSTYTNGYFYKCVATTEDNNTTYSWEQENVQPAPSNVETTTNKVSSITSSSTNVEYAGAKAVWDLVSGASGGANVGTFYTYNNTNPFNFKTAELGVYFNTSTPSTTDTFYAKIGIYTYSIPYFKAKYLIITQKYDNATSGDTIGYICGLSSYQLGDNTEVEVTYEVKRSSNTITVDRNYPSSISNLCYYLSNRTQKIVGEKTFTTIPKQNNTTAPTQDVEFTNKKYVDDKPTTYTGYDATKTQILKNVNGTLTWVDEA